MVPNVIGTKNESWSSGIGGGGGGGTEAGLKKGPWTAGEDSILTEYVRKHGEGNWNAVQRNSGLNRCGKSCRLRWANHLRPNLKKGAFSPDEERTILELHAKFGNKWARMASQLPGRTDNEIKNYWNTRVKRRQRQGLPLYPHDMHPLSAPATPTASASASASAPTTPTPTPTPTSAVPHFHFPASQSVAHIQSLSPLSSPNPVPFSPCSFLSHSFPFHRTPPILGNPVRFNRSNGQFSLPLSPDLRQNSNAFLIQSPLSQHTEPASFQFPTHLTANLMENLRTQYESQHLAMSLVNSELPSNQIIMESEAVPPVNHCGLLDDLFADAQALDASKGTRCLVPHDDKRFFDGFNKMDDSNPAHFYLGEAQKEEVREAASLGQYDWSKLLNGIPSTVPEGEWYDTRGEISDVHSSNLVCDEGDLDLQNLTSFFQVPSESDIGRTPTSCAWDNLPGIP